MKEYKHNCEKCIYVESNIVEGVLYDWYVCNSELLLGDLILGRYGDKDDEYLNLPIQVFPLGPDSLLGSDPKSSNLLERMMEMHVKFKQEREK